MSRYDVYAGNIGNVYSGNNEKEALKVYREYVSQSKTNYGRAAGEDVTLMKDHEITREYFGTLHNGKDY